MTVCIAQAADGCTVFGNQVSPGQIASVNTGMGPYTSGSACPAQVVAAQVAE